MQSGAVFGYNSAEAAFAAYQANSAQMPRVGKKSPEAIAASSKEFEALFIAQMLQHMFADVPFGTELDGDKESQDVYRSLVLDEYGKLIARSGGIGVADYVQREMLRQQEIEQQQIELRQRDAMGDAL